jgi:glycosyltransferase involved in cell wall biosynthesis
VLAQTFKKFEIIVVDDGSIDNSLQICRGVVCNASAEVQIIEQKNSGVSVARNNGVKQTKYDYIAFLDADDWWEPTFLEEMSRLIAEFPEAGIYGSNYFYIKNRQKRIINIGVDKNFQSGYIDYFKVYAKMLSMPLWTGAVVIRKSIFEEMNGFKPQLKLGEDFDLWVRVALKYKVALLNKPLSNYNQDVELQRRAVGNLHNPKTHILWNLDYLAEEEQINENLKQLLDNMRVYSLFPYYLNEENREEAKAELAKVDWSRQSYSEYKRYYKTPIGCLKISYKIKLIASKIKKILISLKK